ncbi:Protein furry [Taenia crassiceps]|uniref:Protein furry n=1 Tax=Taenia crassiceps TaxID=6207 RepID=A0ABR4Q5X4_9CEST
MRRRSHSATRLPWLRLDSAHSASAKAFLSLYNQRHHPLRLSILNPISRPCLLSLHFLHAILLSLAPCITDTGTPAGLAVIIQWLPKLWPYWPAELVRFGGEVVVVVVVVEEEEEEEEEKRGWVEMGGGRMHSLAHVLASRVSRQPADCTNPGELVLHSLLKQFASICQSKVESAIDEKVGNDLFKCMRLQEDMAFQQLLSALHTCAEHALPCLLQAINKWYDTQHSSGALYPFRRTATKTSGTRSHTLSAATGQTPALAGGRDLLIRSMHVEGSSTAIAAGSDGVSGTMSHSSGGMVVAGEAGSTVLPLSSTFATPQESTTSASWLTMSTSARENMAERRDLCIDILYCQALTSVLKQLPYHPGHDDIINKILDRSFKHFEYKENLQVKPNAENINTVADMYAKVVGELSQTRFNLVRQHFSTQLEHLRAKESSSHTMHSIISLLMVCEKWSHGGIMDCTNPS